MPLLSGLVYFLYLGFASAATPEETRTITEEEALRLLESSPAARSLALEARRAEARARLAGIWPSPEIFLSRESSLNTIDRFLEVAQPLPVSGRPALERGAADRAAEAEVLRVRQRLLALRADLRLAFHSLLLAQGRSARLTGARAELEELTRTMRVREQAGESSGFDRARVERELAETEADLFESRIGEAKARLGLAALLPGTEGVELSATGSLERAEELPSLDALLARGESRADVVAFERERQSAETAGRAAARLRVPELVLQAGSKSTETFAPRDTGSVVSLNVSIPLFNRGGPARDLARVEQELARSRREALLRLVRAEIEAAHAELRERRQARESYQSGSDPEALVASARVAYEEGEADILQLIDAYRVVLAVRLRRLELAFGERRAAIELDRVVGEEVSR